MSIVNCRAIRVVLSMMFFFVAAQTHAQTELPAYSSSASSPVDFQSSPVLQSTTPIPGSSRVPGDFNGDQTSDLLWFNPTLSQVGYWTMQAVQTVVPEEGSNGVTVTGTHVFDVTPGYFVGAVGDFNGDGFADLVFTSAQHDLWLWTNNQHGGFTSTEIGTYPANWHLVGAGDIDGDGYDDLLWMDYKDCEFAYWTMHGATRTGYKIIPITCGYFPVSIGYYTPTNRISIMWTSRAGDLYVWDSTGDGFKSYNLSAYVNTTGFGLSFANALSIGGGYQGAGIGYITYWQNGGTAYNDYFTMLLTRNFDSQGNQTGVVSNFNTNNGVGTQPANGGGYLIEGNGINATGIYYLSATGQTLSTAGLYNPSYPNNSGPDAFFLNGAAYNTPTWTYPAGWFVVGAPFNESTPPWE
jgi:hypothetical protein